MAIIQIGTEVMTIEEGDILYVDPMDGSDGYVGNVDTDGNRLKTVQEAINRFMPPLLPPRNWTSSVQKRIVVKYTAGMTFKEAVIKPAHIGQGIMIIEGEMATAGSLIQTGIAALTPGYNARTRVSFTTSSLAPSSLDGYFAESVPDIISGTTEEFSYFEHFAIIDNDADSVELAAAQIPSSEGFGFVDTATIRLVTPQVTWDVPDFDAGDIGPYTTAITNEGGSLIIKGFIWSQAASSLHTFAIDQSKGTIFNGGVSTTVDKCIMTNGGYVTNLSNTIRFNSCFIDNSTSGFRLYNSNYVSLERSYARLNSRQITFARCASGTIKSCYFYFVGGTSVHVAFTSVDTLFCSRSDFRNGVNLQVIRANGSIERNNFEGVTNGNPAIEVIERSYLNISNNVGATGNVNYGINIREASYVQVGAGNTFSGALGDIKVGEAPVITWNDLPLTDAVTLSRIE